MDNLVDEYFRKIRAAQRKYRTLKATKAAVAAYDQLLDELLARFESASESERDAIRVSMSRESCGLLLGAAEGAATWAVREVNVERLRIGLAALLIENLREDSRESLIGLTLLDNSARKLSSDLRGFCEEVRQFGALEGSELFDLYFAEGGKSLDQIGCHESLDKAGEFCYSRTW